MRLRFVAPGLVSALLVAAVLGLGAPAVSPPFFASSLPGSAAEGAMEVVGVDLAAGPVRAWVRDASVVVAYQVDNRGSEPAPAFVAVVCWSDAVRGSECLETPIEKIDPLGNAEVRHTLPLLEAGAHYCVAVDPENRIREARETNNAACGGIDPTELAPSLGAGP